MTSTADTIIATLRTEHDQLASFVSGLAVADLTRPSGADRWDVSEVLSHLGSGAEINLATLEAALAGAPNPGGEFNQGVWARWNAMSPAERADGFGPANEKLISRFEALDAGTRSDLRIDMGFLPQPVEVATVARMRLSEYAFHAWDVRVAFDDAATLTPEATAILLGSIGDMFGWVAKPAELAGRQATVRVEVTAPERGFGLVLGERVLLTDDAPDPADGVLVAPAEAWLRLVVGRLAPRHTPAAVQFKGAGLDLDDLRRVFPGF